MGNCDSNHLSQDEEEEVQRCDTRTCKESKFTIETGPSSNWKNKSPAKVCDLTWPNGIVPYELDTRLDFNRKRILKAMRTIENHSRIKFVERNNQKIHLKITRDDGCYYYRGDTGHPRLSLGMGCEDFGTVLHELLHALGFPHEQKRPDRDKYIIIHWKNIERGQESQFSKLKPHEYKWLQYPFDYDSIMMYEGEAFSKNGRETIEAKDGRPLPRKTRLSSYDMEKLQRL